MLYWFHVLLKEYDHMGVIFYPFHPSATLSAPLFSKFVDPIYTPATFFIQDFPHCYAIHISFLPVSRLKPSPTKNSPKHFGLELKTSTNRQPPKHTLSPTQYPKTTKIVNDLSLPGFGRGLCIWSIAHYWCAIQLLGFRGQYSYQWIF